MESQPNLASTGSGANLQLPPKTFLGPSSQIFGAKKSTFWPLLATSALDTAYLRNKTAHWQTQMSASI